MGFVKSIRRFDPTFDVKLSTYAVPYILGEIKRFLRDDGPVKVSRSLKELNIKIMDLKREYQKQGKELSICEIAKELKVPKEEVILAIESCVYVESIENATYNDQKTSNKVTIVDTLSSNVDEATLITNKITIQNLIERLNEKEKEVILLRFYKEKTQSEVARILGVSQVQVSRIEKKILANMKQQLVS